MCAAVWEYYSLCDDRCDTEITNELLVTYNNVGKRNIYWTVK